ncbi:hypothetical protein K504DRAFT_459841 [Pleomassaria siparia CBS 279.74]|uniref:Uncharacterized protein n=1 Tax=Pleomassaria siparia CBS 279.74 TaxID=1314801 RepID=A0A6G1JYX2_9PLEO|nr:hypothetical protein K504DRAFT_459841 [Pleomassaria siparia CBS 279.74]
MTSVQPSKAPDTSTSSSQSTLQRTRANLAFLANPATAPGPASRRTRAFLRTTRYTLKFIFWRLVRYAKYAAIGSLTAFVAGTAIGSAVSGVGFILAPTGILGGATVGLLWGVGKIGWRGWRRFARKAKDGASDARRDEKDGAEDDAKVKELVEKGEEGGLRADPW